MQLDFWHDSSAQNMALETISKMRLKRYLRVTKNNNQDAIKLYFWNTELSQSLYLSLQCWEIALRNKINNYLCTKFQRNWPYDRKLYNILDNWERKKLEETKDRQKHKRRDTLQTDHIVADLSLGFWIALLGKKYTQPFGWHTNMHVHLFTYGENLSPNFIRQKSAQLLILRNRVAHHEPIFHLNLPPQRAALGALMKSLCPITHGYVEKACSFDGVWHNRPFP